MFYSSKEITRCATARNSKHYIELLKGIEADKPTGDIFIITDSLSSHNSLETRTWLADHPRIYQVFIPKGACWLNLQEGWWRLFCRDTFAGQSFANADEIEHAMQMATVQLNYRAKPWIWGRPPKTRRHLCRLFFLSLLRHVALTCEAEVCPRTPSTDEAVGIGLGVSKLATLSTGDVIENPKHYRRAEKKLAKAQQALARKKRGSKHHKKIVLGRVVATFPPLPLLLEHPWSDCPLYLYAAY